MQRWLKLILLGILFFSSVGVLSISLSFNRLLTKPLLAGGNEPVILSIAKNSSAGQIVQSLKSKNLIQSSYLLLTWIRLKGLAPHLKAGIYEVMPQESLQQFLNKVVAGQVLVKSFTIIEGTTLSQVTNNLKNAPFLKYETKDWQILGANLANYEGLLLADTYNYEAGSDAKQLLERANKKLQSFLESCWQSRNPTLPFKSPYELLIAASILEKETSLPVERKIISGILVNRLNKNMPLQMDPTIIYALGLNYRGKLSHEDLAINSPYNTYRYRGLPPTPIAMVSKTAIEAAAHPMLSNYLYFVAKGDGSHYFSTSYEEQKKAIARLKGKEAL